MSKQDRQGARTPADLERKYNFEKRFDDAMEAAEAASSAVESLDKKLDANEVFDRLTNNGESQGIFRGEDGNIYINASYLVTGILKSKDGETFYLDLVNGILKGKFAEFSISGKTVDEIASDKSSTALQDAEKYADNAAQSAVDAQTQTDVFDKLTNNGAAEGLFYQNGQLFINASYLTTGILKSLDGIAFYLDLVNGILKGSFTELNGKAVSWKDNGDGTYTLIGAELEE